MKALIKVGYGCNENCLFCHTRDTRHINGSSAEVHAKIVRAKELGHTMVVLSGGEATIRPEITEWAARIAALDMDFGLVTNGLMLAYPELLARLRAHRLRYVYMSLHGADARIHNRMVRAESFASARRAIDNLAGLGLDFTLNTVVTRNNLDHLLPIVDLALDYPDVRLKFSMVAPKGGGESFFDILTPRVAEVAARVSEALSRGISRAGPDGPRFAHDGIPLCLLPGHEDLYDDLKTHGFATMVEIGERDFFPVDDLAKIQPEPCHGCAMRGPCPGLYRGYHQRFGHDELRPVGDRPRSNSFNYRFRRLVTSTAPPLDDFADCPLLADPALGITPWDRGRHLFVKNGPRIALFRTDTRDFADVEIAAIKHDAGQIYLDVSTKPAPDDFAADLLQLRRSSLCEGCPENPRCTGMFEPVKIDVFSRDDRIVRELVAEISGDVLDIGCGHGRYGDVLAPRVESGAVRYLGIDPDGDAIAGLAERWPWAELAVAGAESLAGHTRGRRFDHILVLRSWNHLRDPDAAVRAMSAALRPDGILTIVDNVAFGLARTRRQVARAEASAAGFEHFRNHGAGDVAALLSGHPLRLIERREVGPATSNQWLLRYRKSAERLSESAASATMAGAIQSSQAVRSRQS